MIDLIIFKQAVIQLRDGVTISDARLPDNPLIFVNNAFEQMTGYSNEEALNRNCRYLQGEQTNQRDISVLRNAIRNKNSCLVTLRNYRKDGSMFWNELSLSPVFGADGEVTHFIGIQKDVTARVELELRIKQEYKSLNEKKASLENLVIYDSLTGIYNRRYFEAQFEEYWQAAIERKGSLTVMMVDVDYFKLYNDAYGHLAGDEVLKIVASTLEDSMKRATDFVARYGGEEFVIIANDLTVQQAIDFANSICAKLRALNIEHKASPNNFVTISCGVAQIVTILKNTSPISLLSQADKALYQAKADGRNQAVLIQNSMN